MSDSASGSSREVQPRVAPLTFARLPDYLAEESLRSLRRRLRGHAKALGDDRKRNGQQDTQRLVWEVEVTLRGSVEPIHNAVTLAEPAVEKGAKALLLPVSSRRQLFDLSDEMATKVDIEFYQDGRDALMKSLAD